MPLPQMADRRAYHFDKNLELRDIAAAALSATGSSTGIAFPIRDIDLAKVVINHPAITGTINGSNNWVIAVQVSDAVAGTYVTIATTAILTAAPEQIELPISGAQVTNLLPNANFVRVTATKTGTIGNLSYGAFISPSPA